MPVSPPGCPIGPALARSGLAGRSPSSAASAVSGRGGTRSGRKAAGTGRGYLPSRRREPDIGRPGIVRRNLHGLQGELHHLEEGRPGDLVTVVLAPRVLNVDGYDQLRVVRGRDADVAGAILAKAVALAGLGDLRSAGLRRHCIAGYEAPGLPSLGVHVRHLLEDGHQLAGSLSADDALAGWRPRRGELPGRIRGAR